MRFEGVGAKVFIEDIGAFAVTFYPEDDVTYEKMLENKKYIAQKVIEQLNRVFLQTKKDFDEGVFNEN